jgi:hypothetical protein
MQREKIFFFSILALFSSARKRLENAGETTADRRESGKTFFDHFKNPTPHEFRRQNCYQAFHHD